MKKNKQAARNKKKAPAQAVDTIAPLEDLREVRAFTDPETGVQYLVYRTMDGVAMLPRFDASGRFKTAEDGDESKRGRDDAWEGVSLEEEARNARLASRILNDDTDR